jgi:sigma-B regulation protein RsbU (phosphoserine phosphatase)
MPTESNSTRPRVWIVDDSPLEADLMRRALAPLFEVEVFHDAAALLERSSHSTPSLIVADWYMPGVSGEELCAVVRQMHDAA